MTCSDGASSASMPSVARRDVADAGVSKQEAFKRILDAKRARRRELARLPFEEKFTMVVEMNQLSNEARSSTRVQGSSFARTQIRGERMTIGSQVFEWLKSKWGIASAAVVTTSAVWGFFFTQTVALKNERIQLLEVRAVEAGKLEGLPRRVEQLEIRVGFFQRLLRVDPLDGRLSLGTGMSVPSELSTLLAEGEAKAKAREFDHAIDQARRMEELFPDSAGAPYIRFLVDSEKGYDDAAAEDARRAIALAPKDQRLISLYAYLVNYLLKRGDKKAAEDLARRALELAPEDKELAGSFQRIFGFLPKK